MARKTAVSSGLLSDPIWESSLLATAPAPTATGATISTAGVFTGTFTAPNTTGKTTGVWLWFANFTRDYTITLQEATVDTACSVTVPLSSIVFGWNYIRFPTPYQWTATTANRYRFKIAAVGSNGGTIAATSSVVHYMDTHDTVGTLATNDDAWIGGHIGATTTPINVEVVGTSNVIGSGTEKGGGNITTGRTGGAGLQIANGGRLWSNGLVANTLQVRGIINVTAGGHYDRVAHPTDFSVVTKLIQDNEAANGNYWIAVQDGGILHNVGAESTPLAEYVSGTGTASSRFTVDRDTTWQVGMELIIEGNTYLQLERRFIRTVYNAREFQLASTPGGAEAALTHSHAATSSVVMISRNNVIENETATRGGFFSNTSTTKANCNFNWSRWNDMSFASGNGGFSLRPGSNVVNYDGSSDHMVFSGGNSNRQGWTSITTASEGVATGVVMYLPPSGNTGSGAVQIGGSTTRSVNQTYNDFIMIGTASQGMILTSAYNNTFNNCRFIGNNTANAVAGHALAFINSGANTFNNCRFNTSRRQAVYSSGAVQTVFNNCRFGDIGTNEVSVFTVLDTFNDIVLNSSTFGGTIVSGHQGMLEGSRIGFHRLQNEDRRHRAYQPNVEIFSTGSGLTDTTSDTTFDTDSLAMKLTPLSAGVYGRFSFYMPQRAGNTIIFSGKLRKTADFNGNAAVDLYLDGSSSPDSSYTLTGDDSTWIPFVLSADYTSGVNDRNARIEIRVRGTAGSVYLDTLFNSAKATNPIGSLDLWQNGVPNDYLVSTVASASEISEAVRSELTPQLDEILSNTDATQAKVDQL